MTTEEPRPYFRDEWLPGQEHAALGRPPSAPVPVLQIKELVLADDFEPKLADLDNRLSKRGIGFSKERLLSLGKERFEQLLAADRKARVGAIGAGADLSQFGSVQAVLQAYECQLVPRRTTHEQAARVGKDRDAARQITGWDDLWKATHERREVVDDLYSFHDHFDALLLGHSMLEQLSSDGRTSSPLFRGGKGPKAGLFLEWLKAAERNLVLVRLADPLWAVMAWLTNEKSTLDVAELAKDFFNIRLPSQAQQKIAAAALDGFLLGLDDWTLWDHIGKRTRTAVSETRLASWRGILAKRFPRVTQFHAAVTAAHWKPVGWGHEHEFDAIACRAFIDTAVEKLRDTAGALLALGVEEVFPGSVIARFQTAGVLVDGDCATIKGKAVSAARQLAAAFPGSPIKLTVEEATK